MGDGSALDIQPGYLLKPDPESGVMLLWKAGSTPDNAELIGPLIQQVMLVDRDGNEVCLTTNQRVHVVDSSGLPHLFPVDVAGANGYELLGTVPHAATRLFFNVSTKDAILSFDGVADHLFLGSLKGQLQIDGLDLPAGTPVYAKNAAAGQNFANLYVAVW